MPLTLIKNSYYHTFFTSSSSNPTVMTRTIYNNAGIIQETQDISFGGMNIIDVLSLMDNYGNGTNPYTLGIVDSTQNKICMDLAYSNVYTKALTAMQQRVTMKFVNTTYKEPHTYANYVYTVTVSGGVYWLSVGGAAASQQPSVTFTGGMMYVFDQSHTSNLGNTLVLGQVMDATPYYTTNVVTNNTAGSPNAYTLIDLTGQSSVALKYFCKTTINMGPVLQPIVSYTGTKQATPTFSVVGVGGSSPNFNITMSWTTPVGETVSNYYFKVNNLTVFTVPLASVKANNGFSSYTLSGSNIAFDGSSQLTIQFQYVLTNNNSGFTEIFTITKGTATKVFTGTTELSVLTQENSFNILKIMSTTSITMPTSAALGVILVGSGGNGGSSQSYGVDSGGGSGGGVSYSPLHNPNSVKYRADQIKLDITVSTSSGTTTGISPNESNLIFPANGNSGWGTGNMPIYGGAAISTTQWNGSALTSGAGANRNVGMGGDGITLIPNELTSTFKFGGGGGGTGVNSVVNQSEWGGGRGAKYQSYNPQPGTPNTGGGGGGMDYPFGTFGSGGSGVAYIYYSIYSFTTA